MFDESKIGQSFAPFTYEVQRNKIHELTTAMGDTNPVYHSREAAQEAGFPDVPISPTTPTTFSFWGNRQRGSGLAEVGINVSRILHGEEEYEYIAPIYPNDVLTGTTTLVEGKTRQGSGGPTKGMPTRAKASVSTRPQPMPNTRPTVAPGDQ